MRSQTSIAPLGVAVLALRWLPTWGLRAAPRSQSAEIQPRQEGPFGTDANHSTRWFFLTHHKTGTHLMVRICSATARILSDRVEHCAMCYRQKGILPNGNLACSGGSQEMETEGISNRFVVMSNMDGPEFSTIQRWSPDHRVVHMVRDPLGMVASDYQYDKRKSQLGQMWDVDVKNLHSRLLKSDLSEVSKHMSHFVDHMCRLEETLWGDSNVITMHLEDFERNFDDSARRLLGFLYGHHHPLMENMLKEVTNFNPNSNPSARRFGDAVSNRTERVPVLEALREMKGAGDAGVTAAASCEGAAEARPWARKLLHNGSRRRGAQAAPPWPQ